MNHSASLAAKDRIVRLTNTLPAFCLVVLLVALPFHLVIKRTIPGPAGTYWKEGLLGLLVLLWAIRSVIERRLLLTGTPLDGAVLAYLGLLIIRFTFDLFAARLAPQSALVGIWGLYVSVLYLPLYWLIPAALAAIAARWPQDPLAPNPPQGHANALVVRWILLLLVGVGSVLALGGLLEFLLDVPLWPSDEIRQRLGHADFYIYSSRIRRVYFTLDSPTTLANTLAMLLPLGLALAFGPAPSNTRAVARHWGWQRISSAIGSLMMAACIVVTFSRGIWVAATLSLLAMALLGRVTRSLRTDRFKKPIFVSISLLILVGLAGATFLRMRARTVPRPTVGVIELSPEAYAAAPVVEIRQKLLQNTPIHGQAITQTWTLLDPIAGTQATKTVLYQHPPEQGKAELIYQVHVPPVTDLRPALRFSLALSPAVWSPDKGDGTSFQIHVTDAGDPLESRADDQGTFAFVRYLNPKHNPSDRRWRNFIVDLSPWAGRAVTIALIAEAGPADDWAFDWGGWAHPQVVSIESTAFGERPSAQQDDAIAHHARSILDWGRDETNRDRLAAWSLSLAAWRASPVWGQGLGTTGAAALRTRPETAFVTESQVLKSLVELGLPGLLTWAYLWFQIARTGSRAYRRAGDVRSTAESSASAPDARVLLWGILTSLMIVFVEGWVYQNLECKQVNAYFWVLVGLLGLLARRPTRSQKQTSTQGPTWLQTRGRDG